MLMKGKEGNMRLSFNNGLERHYKDSRKLPTGKVLHCPEGLNLQTDVTANGLILQAAWA